MDEEPTGLTADLCVCARDRHVVQEDLSVGAASARRHVVLDEECRPRVGATLHEKQSLSGLQLVMREGELLSTFLFDLHRADRERGVLLEGSSTLCAETRVVAVRMSTVGAIQARWPPRPNLPVKVGVEP